MAETYTSGLWNVNEGYADEFIAAWKDFVEWASEQPGSGTFRPSGTLTTAAAASGLGRASRSSTCGRRRTSSGPHEAVQGHVDSFEPSTYELVTQVG